MSTEQKPKKVVSGIVSSDKMNKTIAVTVEYLAKHPKYGKYIRKRTTYKAHDPENQAHIGDKVTIRETRPLSKTKRWELVSVNKES